MLAVHDPSTGKVEMVDVSGNGGGKHEFLAKAIVTSKEDDSLAIDNSLLRDFVQANKNERRWGLYIAMWIVMIIISVYVAIKVFFYRLFVRPEDKERQLLGPEKGTWFFDASHHIGYVVRNGVTTSAALDAIYSVDVAISQPRTMGERLIRFWLDQPDGQAVRNRLRITFKAIQDKLEELYGSGRREIKFLALACGSAQASIEAVANFLAMHKDAKVNLWLVDLSESSLKRAARLAQNRGVADAIHIVPENLKDFVSRSVDGSWDLIEMVGFLDYRKEPAAVWICQEIRRLLAPHGLFITANIAPSPWSFVVRWVINWPLLIRRKPEEFKRILKKADFSDGEIELIIEPNRIHPVALCRRTA